MKVVIVESPTKVKTIGKYLGRDYDVYASFGHVRDLAPKDGSVDPEHDFAMRWEIDPKAAKRLAEIAGAVKGAERVILATDPDREGEAISWHVYEILKAKKVLKDKRVDRVVFNAVTRDAVAEAMRSPREIDEALVDAYRARRALDYLVGFNLSPVLWRKLPGARSAGRVQSVALRIVCDRELEIEKFVAREYWSILAHLKTLADAPFTARLVGADGKKIARLDIGSGKEAEDFKAALETASFKVVEVDAKPLKRHPYPPFTTSTLQQEASRKLGLAPARTMQIAQRLYEGLDIGEGAVGLITYMRTDGVDLAPEAVQAARKVIAKDFGDAYAPAAPRKYAVKAKNAQEAHEAIRPTEMTRRPRDLARHLEPEQAKLYELIWNRTLACQMESAELERTTVDILAEAAQRRLDFRATGQVVRFPGFLALYQEGRDDDEDEDSVRLPPMRAGEPLTKERIEASRHFTEPPPRYTEATLVKRMEELGIGRPSTYASTLAVLRDRDYVRLEKKRLIPQDKGRLVTAFLEAFFAKYVGYDFTADLEEKLDRVSNSEIDWKDLLRDFWTDFSGALDGAKDLRTSQALDSLNDLLGPHIFPARADGGDPRQCPSCGTGRLSLKLGKFGAFIGCSNYPACKFTRVLSPNGQNGAGAEGERPGVRALGLDPKTGDEITLRGGRFGDYVQQGEGEKPKRSSLPKRLSPDDVTLETAVALLSLPREVARHPVSGEPILAGIGRYGSYVQHGKTYANLSRNDDVLTIGANRAIDLIVAKESGAGRGFGAGARALGDHPTLGGAVTVKSGRFGPYVNHGKINATLPRGSDPASLTLEEAVAMLAAKAAGGGGGRALGDHPDGGPIVVRDGRFGAYVNWGKVNATIPKSISPEKITLDEALALIAEREGRPAHRNARAGAKAKRKAPVAKARAAKTAPAPAPRAKTAKPAAAKRKAAKAKPAAGKARRAAAKPAAVKGKAPAAKAKRPAAKARIATAKTRRKA
jgi:DNA topoisomerase-1